MVRAGLGSRFQPAARGWHGKCSNGAVHTLPRTSGQWFPSPLEVYVVITHPAELTLRDISEMSRVHLIEQLLVFNDYCAFQFNRDELFDLPNNVLRGLLYAARRHYHSRGY